MHVCMFCQMGNLEMKTVMLCLQWESTVFQFSPNFISPNFRNFHLFSLATCSAFCVDFLPLWGSVSALGIFWATFDTEPESMLFAWPLSS